MLRLWFFGSGAIAVPTLRAVVSAHTVIGVISQPDRPQGRGRRSAPTPVNHTAQSLALLVVTPTSLSEPMVLDQFRRSQPDLFLVMAYGKILPQPLFTIPRLGAFNIHPSLLPRHRGAAPIPWTILQGDPETGITLFQMDGQVDHGPWLLQERFPVALDETAVSLSERLGLAAPTIVLNGLALLEQGKGRLTPQEDRLATQAPRLTKADGWIDWSVPAEVIARRVRALVPWPGSMTSWQGRALKILRTSVADSQTPSMPGRPAGTILQADSTGILVQAGRGAIRLHELQVAGGRPLEAAAFLRGHPMRRDEVLGSRETP